MNDMLGRTIMFEESYFVVLDKLEYFNKNYIYALMLDEKDEFTNNTIILETNDDNFKEASAKDINVLLSTFANRIIKSAQELV
ncbi:MAG: hypothetical protein R3Y21_03715 [Mycoplasmatota bacterium]